MKYNNFAFVDLETSGTGARRDRIIEIGILRVENNQLIDTFKTLVNPEVPISSFIEEMTGITTTSLENAPLFSEIKNRVLEMLDDCILVAHNVRFDYGFLKKEFAYCQNKFSMKQCCTVKLSRLLYPQFRRHNLDAIIERFHFSCENRHRAFDDAKVLWDFFNIAQKEFSEEVFEKALQTVMKQPSLPVHLPKDTAKTLPERPGVYLFYGDQEVPLYIGKSVNIKDRVLSHFAADHTSSKEMHISQQVKHIETIPTAGELSALLLESKLIKEKHPMYNKQLRYAKKLIKLVKTETQEGYMTVQQEVVTGVHADEITDIVGIFTSKKKADSLLFTLAKEYALCHKLLGVEKTKKSCFAHRLGQCRGACIKKEIPIAYNMRFIQAFSKHKIKQWPFKGPIVIEEVDEMHDQRESFVIDNWCLIGNANDILESSGHVIARNEETWQSHIMNHENYLFDTDLYKILVHFLLDKKNYKYVKVLNSSVKGEACSSKKTQKTITQVSQLSFGALRLRSE